PSFIQQLPYQVTLWTVPSLTGQKEQLRPFELIGYFPGVEPLPLGVQRAFCEFVEEGGGFFLFGNRWISQLTQQPLESILPVTCGGEPEKISLRILLDCSGSMSEIVENQFTRLQLCTQALEYLVAQIPLKIKTFFDIQIWAVNESARLCALDELKGFQARGKTYLGKGLQQILFPASASRKLLFILSDGETQDAQVFIQQGKKLQKEQVRQIALQLPTILPGQKGEEILKEFLGVQGSFIPIRSYQELQEELWKIVDEESQLYYRQGPFEVLKELPAIQGYARSKLRVDAVEKQVILTEPFLAFRPVKQGASAFLALDPEQEGWLSYSEFNPFFLESIIQPLEELRTPEVSYQQEDGKIRLFSRKKNNHFSLRQGAQRWEFEPIGFGYYQTNFPKKIQVQEIQLFEEERLIAILPGETEPELQNLFIDYSQLMKLPSLMVPANSRARYSPFFLYGAIFFLFSSQVVKTFLPKVTSFFGRIPAKARQEIER
ncbi:MAG: vWA domain-containing protein, partial [Planctomycetota bacterium]